MSKVGVGLGCTVGVDIDLMMARREAVRRMTDSVTIGRFERVRPPGSLDSVLTLVEVYYAGKARVKYPSASAFTSAPAGQQLAQTNIVVSVPSGSGKVPTGALVFVDHSKSDDALNGRYFRVKGPAQAGQTTAHRYPVVEES